MSDEQNPVAWLNKDGVIVGHDEGGTAKPLYLHTAPAVVKQLVGALKIISIWAKNGSTEKDFDDIVKIADKAIAKATGGNND
jgi:hypothetical protein